jgi:hypothetical protein
MFPTFTPAGAYPGFGFSQDNNINFGPNGPLNLDPNLGGLVHMSQEVIWQGSNDQQNDQRDNTDQSYSRFRFRGRENRGLDDEEQRELNSSRKHSIVTHTIFVNRLRFALLRSTSC